MDKKKRPFRTHYFKAAASGSPDSQGYSKTERGAIRGAVVRIFVGEYTLARIYDEDGVLVYTIFVGSKGLQVGYGSAVSIPRSLK